jgi:hypothetical protein
LLVIPALLHRHIQPQGLPFRLEDYLELVDWTDRIIHSGKRGAIAEPEPPILERLDIEISSWLHVCQNFEKQFTHFAGDAAHEKGAASALGYQCVYGISNFRSAFD